MRFGRSAARWLLLLGVVAAIVAFWAAGGGEWLRLERLQANREQLLAYTEQHYTRMLLLGAAVYVLATALSVPGATILSLAAGFLFGRWVGTLLIVIAATLGATLVFLGARYLFADAARRRLGERAQKLIVGFRRDAFNYLLFLRLVPLFPFWLVNLVPAFTGIRTRTYMAATAIGILPGAFVLANLGQSLARIRSADDLLSTPTLLALALLGLLALVPVLVKRFRSPSTPGDSP